MNSIRELMEFLGIKSRTTIRKYMNHVEGLYAPNLKEKINIRYINSDNSLKHKIIHRKTKNIHELSIPDTSLLNLTPNLLYVYRLDFSLFSTFKSINEAAKTLNPNHEKLSINLRGKEVAISRAKNKHKEVSTEVGLFYFAENPNTNRWLLNQQGRFPLILKDVKQDLDKFFTGIKPVQLYLEKILEKKPEYKTIKLHYEKGTLYKNQFLFIPKR